MQEISLPWTIWLTDWRFEPIPIAAAVFAVAFYYLAARRLGQHNPHHRLTVGQQAAFWGAVGLTLFTILSPLDTIGELYSFTVHMVQHLLMIIPIPILLLLGVPEWLAAPLFRLRPVDWVMRVLTQPIIATVLFNLVFMGWHIPRLYELSLTNYTAHELEHLMFLTTALFSWWPIMGPRYQLRTPFLKIAYVFVQKLPPTILGAILVFAEAPLYATYANQTARLWGWTPLLDQQIGGVVMWIPAGIVYLIILSVVFFRWIGNEEAEGMEQQGTFA